MYCLFLWSICAQRQRDQETEELEIFLIFMVFVLISLSVTDRQKKIACIAMHVCTHSRPNFKFWWCLIAFKIDLKRVCLFAQEFRLSQATGTTHN